MNITKFIDIVKSFLKRIKVLPEDTLIYPGMPNDMTDGSNLYQETFRFLKYNLTEDFCKMMKDDLDKKHMVFELSSLDWIEIYNKLAALQVSDSFDFLIHKGTMKSIGAQEYNDFIKNSINLMTNRETQWYDSDGIIYFISKALEEKVITVRKEAHTKKKQDFNYDSQDKFSIDETISIIDKVIKKLEIRAENDESTFLEFALAMKDSLQDIIKKDANKKITSMHYKMNKSKMKPREKEVSKIENNEGSVSRRLSQALEGLEDKVEELEEELLQKVKSIISLGQTIIKNDYSALSIEEQIKFSRTIEKDLPTLIINYLVIPQEMRQTLIDKASNLDLKELLSQSFDKIENEFKQMDKREVAQQHSIQQIQVTANYLKARR